MSVIWSSVSSVRIPLLARQDLLLNELCNLEFDMCNMCVALVRVILVSESIADLSETKLPGVQE